MVKGRYVEDFRKYLARYRRYRMLSLVLLLLFIVEDIFIRDYAYQGVYGALVMMFMLLAAVWRAIREKKEKKRELLLDATTIKKVDDGQVKEVFNLDRFYKIVLSKEHYFSFMNENAYLLILYAENEESRKLHLLLNSDFMEKRLKRLIKEWLAHGLEVVRKKQSAK